jgi:hypothetical protein
MKDILRLPFCLLLIIGSVYYANGELTAVPENVVSIQGTTVTLSCTAASTPTARVMWTEFVTSQTGLILSDNKGVVPTHPNAARYSITGGPLDYNLEIRNLSAADGGRYLCQDINGVPPAPNRGPAEVVVINGDPMCTELATVTGVLVEDRFYQKECEIGYRGNIQPNMTWTGPGDYGIDNSVTVDEAWSRVTFTAHRDIEGGQFVCITRFILPENLPGDAATNTPSYVYTFVGSTLIINWGPKDMDINPRQSIYEIGDVLTCTADAKPTPTYRWTNMRTLVTEAPGQTFTVTEELRGTEQTMRCNANSLIEGSLYTADVFNNVTVLALTTPTTPGTTTPTTPPPADGPCLDLTGQWTSTNPNALVCIEVDSKGNILALIRNGTDPFFVTGNGKTVYNDYRHVGFTGLWPAGSDFGVGGFSGECHRCHGNEILLTSGLARNKGHSLECGRSAGTRLTNLYAFTRFGPPCRNIAGKVYRPSAEHIKRFGILPENIFT